MSTNEPTEQELQSHFDAQRAAAEGDYGAPDAGAIALRVAMNDLLFIHGPHAVHEAFIAECRETAVRLHHATDHHTAWKWETIAARATGATTLFGKEIL